MTVRRTLALALLLLALAFQPLAAAELKVAFGEVEITPPLKDDRPVWLAGYGPGRRCCGAVAVVGRSALLWGGRRCCGAVS